MCVAARKAQSSNGSKRSVRCQPSLPQFGDGLLRRAGCKIDGAEPPFCCCSPSRNVAGLVRPHSRRTNKRVASKRSVGRFCVGHARTANSSPDAKPSGILTAATLPDELRVAAVSPIGHAANTRKNPVCTRDHPQIKLQVCFAILMLWRTVAVGDGYTRRCWWYHRMRPIKTRLVG